MATAVFAEPIEQTPVQRRWPLERVLFALAGTMTLLAGALSVFVSPWFALLSAFIGVNQWLFVLFGACPASLILRRLFSLPSVLYPARAGAGAGDGPDDDRRSCPRSESGRSEQPTTAVTS
jgi:hypothetical protein